MTGTIVSCYRIGEKLGEGAMGAVWKARDLRLDRPVALKFLSPEATAPDALPRLRQEAKALSALNEPHIATIYALDEWEDRPLLVLEYLPGGTLAETMAQSAGPLPFGTVLSYAGQIALGLAAAHRAGIVHRDLKPSNLLFTGGGSLKLVDFGLCRLLHDADGTLTRSAALLGTPAYMSPEQAAGQRATERSDIFSFGVVLYELAAGVRPFGGLNRLAMLDEIRNLPHVPIRRHCPDLPPPFEALIDRMLAKLPEDRLQSAGEVANALHRLESLPSGPAWPAAPVMGAPLLLVCTVGGSPEPVVASILHNRDRALRVCFIGSNQSLKAVQHQAAVTSDEKPCAVCGKPRHDCFDHTGIVERLGANAFHFDVGRFDCIELPDADDLQSSVETLQRQLSPRVEEWLRSGPAYELAIDFTGGTKCMSVALGLVARRWPCHFSYVGGTVRTKGGVGVVVSGREKIVQNQNPWDALGYQVVEDAVTLCNGGDYAMAARLLDSGAKRADEPFAKRAMQTVSMLAEAFAKWDRFEHAGARQRLLGVQRQQLDLDHFLGRTQATQFARRIPVYLKRLDILAGVQEPVPELIADLLANAQRRMREQRFDDAVARIYRAIEACAQCRLMEKYGIPDSGHVSPDRVPAGLAVQWLKDGGVLRPLGLQDDFVLLEALGDPLGKQFSELRLSAGSGSPLAARNLSILAHGFQAVGAKVCQHLWGSALALAAHIGIREPDLIQFPHFQEDRNEQLTEGRAGAVHSSGRP